MSIKKILSVLLSVFIIFSMTAAFPLGTSAAVENLSTYKQYFRRTIGSIARADMYKTNILASLTVSQAIVESRFGLSGAASIGKNLFGIKAFSTWSGMVYYSYGAEKLVCGNFNDCRILSGANFRNEGWRAYSSWIDSISDHSALLHGTRYAAVPGETDYKTACSAVIAAGYTSDAGYYESLVASIESYNLTEFDIISPNEYGVIAIEMSDAEKVIALDGTCTLTANVLANTTVTQGLTWASANEAVATVDQNGVVTAKSSGYTLITATIGDREACCIVTVSNSAAGYNARVTNVTSALNVRADATTSAVSLGQFIPDQLINVTGPAINISAEAPNGWYPVTGEIAGKTVSGYSSAAFITLLPTAEEIKVSKVALNRPELNRDINTSYQLQYAVGPVYAADKTLTWSSSDPSVAGVADGLVTTYQYGTTTITATAKSGASASCFVTVTAYPVQYTAVTTANLKVRPDDSTIGVESGIFNIGSTITVTDNYSNADGHIGDSWYYAEGTMSNGENGVGYSNADYIYLLVRAGESALPTEFDLSDSVYTINSGYLYGTDPSCKVGDFLQEVKNENDQVYDINGTLMTSEQIITTGCTLRLVANGSTTNSAEIVIKGDLNGNGLIDTTDYLILKRYLIGTSVIEGSSLKAAYISDDSNISVLDYIMIKRHYIGIYNIVQAPVIG